MNLKAQCLLGVFGLWCLACETERAASDAGTARGQQCTSVTFEYRNRTESPAVVLAFYDVDGARHGVGVPVPLNPMAEEEFTVPECVKPNTRVRHVVAVNEGNPEADAFTGSMGARVRCVVTVGEHSMSHHCAAE